MKTVRGIFENGVVRLLEDPQMKGTQEVYILFPEMGKPSLEVAGIPADAFNILDGLVAMGGHALEDSERLWEEDSGGKNHP